MIKVITISGSDRPESKNSLLLNCLSSLELKNCLFSSVNIGKLPLYEVALDKTPLPKSVVKFRKSVTQAHALVISTPEYIYNMPARLKNALEWLTTSGELVGKSVLAISYTPSKPRGEKAMQSLLWSLKALDANVVTSLALYQNILTIDSNRKITGDETELILLKESLGLLVGN